MPLIDCDRSHAEPIRAIFNHAIAHTTAIWDDQPRSAAWIDAWFHDKDVGGYPVLGVTDNAGTLRGFATYGPFRPWSGYRHTVEHSLYIAPDHQRQGLGRTLLRELIHRAKQQNYHAMIAGIDADNHASIAFHQALGFTHVGTLPEVGYKFDRWLDLCFYQLLLH